MNLGLGKEFLNLTPKTQFIKGNFYKLALVEIKNGRSGKDQAKRTKRQVESREKSVYKLNPLQKDQI